MPNNRGGVPMYNENAQYNATINPQVPQGSPAMFGTQVAKEMAGMGDTIGKLGSNLVDYALKMQERDDNAFILEKDNQMRAAVTDLLYNPQNGLANTKGKNSFGVTQNYDEAVEKLTQDAISSIGNPALQAKLQEHNMQWVGSLRNTIAKHEGEERFTFYSNQITGAKVNAVNLAAQIGGISGMQTSSSIIASLKGQAMNLLGWDETMADNWEKESNSEAFALIADNYVKSGKISELQTLVDSYGDKVSAKALADAQTKLGVINQQQDAAKMAEDLIAAHPELIDEDGNLDLAKYNELVDKLNGENAEDRYEDVLVSGGGSVNTIDGLMAAISGQESEGNYEAQNGRTKAYGKYQILPGNWPSWSKEAGLGENAERSPENQEKVARFKLNQYLQKYGAEGAMVAWYSGPGNADRWVAGKDTDVWGRPWDAKNGDNNDEPSIREYVQQVSARGGKSSSVATDKLDPGIDASGVDLTGTKPRTIGMINYAHKLYKELTGLDDFWVSCTTGGHAADTAHGRGDGADVGGSGLKDPEILKKFLAGMRAAGAGANDEYNYKSKGWTGPHVDLKADGDNWQTGEKFGGFKVDGARYVKRKVSGYNPVVNNAMKAYGKRKADMIAGNNERQITSWSTALLQNPNVQNARDMSEINVEMDKMGIPWNKRAKVMSRVNIGMQINNSRVSRERGDENWSETQRHRAESRAGDSVSAWMLGKIAKGEDFTAQQVMDLPEFNAMNSNNALSIVQHLKAAEAKNDQYGGWYQGDNKDTFEKTVASLKKSIQLDDMEIPNIRRAVTTANLERKKNGQDPLTSSQIQDLIIGQTANWKKKKSWHMPWTSDKEDSGHRSSQVDYAGGQYVDDNGNVHDADGTVLEWNETYNRYMRP